MCVCVREREREREICEVFETAPHLPSQRESEREWAKKGEREREAEGGVRLSRLHPAGEFRERQSERERARGRESERKREREMREM